MSTHEGRRRIEVEIRGLPQIRHTLVFTSGKRVGDIATKLKHVYDDIKKTDEIKIYRDKFHLPDNENINIIKTGDKIIAYRRETEYVEENEDKGDLMKVREQVLQDKENNFDLKEMELKRRVASLENKEENLKRQETAIKSKEEDMAKREVVLLNDQKVREEILKDKENKIATQKMELKRMNAVLVNMEENLKGQKADINGKVDDLEYREMVWRNDRWDVDEELKQGRKDLLMKEKRIKRRNQKLNQREARVKIKELKLEEVSNAKFEEHYNKATELADRETDLISQQEELDEKLEQLSLEWKKVTTLFEIFKNNYSGVV